MAGPKDQEDERDPKDTMDDEQAIVGRRHNRGPRAIRPNP